MYARAGSNPASGILILDDSQRPVACPANAGHGKPMRIHFVSNILISFIFIMSSIICIKHLCLPSDLRSDATGHNDLLTQAVITANLPCDK